MSGKTPRKSERKRRAPKPKSGLTAKQKLFVAEYLIDCNATQAAIRAGYRPRSAEVHASRLLRNAKVAEALATGQAKLAVKTEVKAEKVIGELATLAFSDIGQILDFSADVPRLKEPATITEAARRAISAVKVKRTLEGAGDNAHEVEVTEFRLWSKTDALDKLARHLGLFKDKVETVNQAQQIVIIENVITAPPDAALVPQESKDGQPATP